MNGQDLKNSILQLAIQGKLVEQREEEGTARELLEQIKAEKEQLIKEGKIKNEKPLPEITEDEVLFDIPESWGWLRLGDCVSNKSGVSYKKDNLDIVSKNMTRILRGGNIFDLSYTFKYDDVMIDNSFVKSELLLRKNMLITPAVTSIEHIGKMARIEQDYTDVAVGGFVLMLIPHISIEVFSQFLLFALSSPYHRNLCRSITNKSGQAFYNLSREKLMEILVPIPPLEEQKRIIAKIEELMPYVEKYGEVYSKIEVFNKKFPGNMQKSILHYAIRGKLVEQRPEEGTVEELYKQIQEEKKRLIKEGKIKKVNPLIEITDEEIPFEIPESWMWVRLVDIVYILGDGIHGTPNFDESGEYYFINGNNLANGVIEIKDNTNRVNADEYLKYKKDLNENTVLVSINGTIGNVAFYNNEKVILGKSACYFNLLSDKLKFYIYWLLKTKYFLDYAVKNATGSTIKNVSLVTMKNFIVPLPPLEEQKRIVAKIEELMPYCQQLVK